MIGLFKVPLGAFNLRLLALVMLLLGTGCAGLGLKPPAPLLQPLPPQSFQATAAAQQQIVMSHKGKAHSLQAVLSIEPEKLTLIALTAVGQRLFTLTWNGIEMQLKQAAYLSGDSAPSAKLPAPQYILSDLQLALWPAAQLRLALSAQPELLFTEQRTGKRRERWLWRGPKLLWHAVIDDSAELTAVINVQQLQLGYVLQIQSQRIAQ